jgi:signal transduction histidine kinase
MLDSLKNTLSPWQRAMAERLETQRQRLSERWPLLSGRWPLVFGNLRAKLIIPYVLLTMALAMIGTFVVTVLVTSSVRERFVNQLLEASRVAADGIVRKERVHLENLRLMAFTQGVPEAMVNRDSAALRELLLPLALNNHIEVFTAIDPQGREILTLAREPESNQYASSEGVDFSGYDLVANILREQQDEIGDKFIGLLSTARGPYLFTSAPVRDASGQLVGALMIGTPLNTILGDLKTQALADVVLLDLAGGVVATTLPPPDEGYSVLQISPSSTSLSTSETHDLQLYNRDFQAVYAPLVVRQQNLGVLGIVLPSNYITAAASTNRNWFGIIFTLGTLAVIGVGYFLAQTIARPILRLRAVSQAVAAGDLEQHTGLNQAGEIGELASAFDRMTLKLRERTAEAAELYTETVQRNKELADANAKLQTARQQLVQSEKLAAVGQLTAGIVHDVKNPLAIIIGLADELPEQSRLDEATLKSLDMIRDNGRRANKIVTDLLKFAREATPEMNRQDIRETIETVLRLTEYLARKGKVQVIKDVPGVSVMAVYDAAQMEQVFMNLVQNAIQAMPDGGSLRVSVSQAKDAVAIAIQDSGIGIPPKHLSRIFDPFFTTKAPGEGTGLGLSVSYGIVTRHGGRIDVESTVGQGSTLTVVLPVNPPTTSNQFEG